MLGMRMGKILVTKIDDFSIATDRCVVIFTTVLTQQTLHQPCLGEFRRYVKNSIKKYLRDLPTFFGNCPRSVSPINANDRVLRKLLWESRFGSGFVFQ